MNGLSATLRQQWRNSSSFRLWTILAIAGLVINLALTVLWQMEIITFEDTPPANDLKIYLEAGNRFLQRENLYIAPRADFGLYAYSPAFAALLGFLTFLPLKLYGRLTHYCISSFIGQFTGAGSRYFANSN